MLFSGEQPTLDNSQTTKTLNAPRNIGFVKVPRDMNDKRVLSKGPVEKGGFYNFGGNWEPQENKGVTWLTHSKSIDQNACRIKVTKLTNGQILVLFETWNSKVYAGKNGENKFVSSHLMTLDQNGKITRAARPTKFPFRLPFADEILRTDTNTAVFYAGDRVGSTGKLVRYEVSLISGPGAGTNKAVTKAPIVTQPANQLPILTKDFGSALPSPLTITHAI